MDLYTVRNNIMKGIPLQELNLRVCFYARVSTEKDEQINSLKNQITFFNDYINKIPKWEFAGSYIDEGISGTRVFKREEFLKMINDAKNGKFDLILTKEISRFSRSTLDSIQYTQELLASGVGVYFLNDNINTILPDSELRLTIMASVAQDEVRKLSERVSFGMKRSIDNGNVLGCSNIYGYEKLHVHIYVIIHYVSNKPWNFFSNHPYRELYYKYLQLTPWKNNYSILASIRYKIVMCARSLYFGMIDFILNRKLPV